MIYKVLYTRVHKLMQHAQGEPADSKSRSGQLSPRRRKIERSVYKFFLYIGPLVQTTSGNASKAVLSSKSDRTLVVVGPTVPAQQKVVFFTITFDPNVFSEIHDSKTF